MDSVKCIGMDVHTEAISMAWQDHRTRRAPSSRALQPTTQCTTGFPVLPVRHECAIFVSSSRRVLWAGS
jgi:hypothetical protein